MILKKLGVTDVQIPEIGLGTWQYRAGSEPLRKGLDSGALFVDTAEAYGTEPIVADAIAGIRNRIFLATKVSPTHFRQKELFKAVDQSLRSLRTSYLDLYQLHEPNDRIPLEETLGAMEELVDAGKIRFVGVSNFNLRQLQRAQTVMRKHPIVSNQVRFNLIDRTIKPDLLDYCRQNCITIIAYSPLGRQFQNILDCDPGGLLAQFGKRNQKTAAQVTLNWCLCHEGVVAIPKGNSVSHVVENCGASDWRLKAEELQQLNDGILFRRRSDFESLLRKSVPSPIRRIVRKFRSLTPRSLRRRLACL